MPVELIFTADDFGRCEAVNRAVIRAHKEGLLTAASLMVGGEAFEQAVEMAAQTPTLAVGLHVVVVDGQAVLPPEDIAHLVNSRGQFESDPVRAGFKYFFSGCARAELKKELRAQFDRFASTGLPLSHVDGHLHMHVHPSVLGLVFPLAEEFGALGFRIPKDRLAWALRYSMCRWPWRAARILALAGLSRRAGKKLNRSRLKRTDFAFGIGQSGQMDQEYVMQILSKLRAGSAEFFFHPTDGARLDPLGPNPHDLQTLLSPQIRHFIAQRAWKTTAYPLLNSPDGA